MADTDTTTTTASQTDPGASGGAGSGAGANGAAGGSGSGDASPAAVSADELQRRALQSQRDRLAAEVADLEQRRSDLGNSQGGNAGGDEQFVTLDDFDALLTRRENVSKAQAYVNEHFPRAHPQIIARAGEYRSAEEFLSAAAQSHQSEVEFRTNETKRIEADVIERLKKAGVQFPDGFTTLGGTSEPQTAPATVTGELTAEQVLALSPRDFDKWAADNPEQAKRLMGMAV